MLFKNVELHTICKLFNYFEYFLGNVYICTCPMVLKLLMFERTKNNAYFNN
jgi:hypothetical protein